MIDGVVIIDKPEGMTSHDVVNKLRKIYKTKRVGHTGTLDPDATGVLPVCIGRATRLAEYLSSEDKEYIAEMTFGQETDTEDASGRVIKSCALPVIDSMEFAGILQQFLGEQTQKTPMFSAVKINGRPLYELARQGIILEDLPLRHIIIHSLEMIDFTAEKALISVSCSKGTYIRTLCVDIARAMQSCAHVTMLRRTSAGRFSLNEAIKLEQLENAEDPFSFVIPMLDAMSDYPEIPLSIENFMRIKNGNAIVLDKVNFSNNGLAITSFDGMLCAVGFLKDGLFQPKKVFIS